MEALVNAAEDAKLCLITEDQCKILEKKFGVCMDEEESESVEVSPKKRKRQIFEEVVREHMKQRLLAAQAHAVLQKYGSPRRKIFLAEENIKAAKRNKLL